MRIPFANLALRLCTFALATFLPLPLLADGMVIPQRAYAIPQIPDQRALIHYAAGKETLVIETTFVGDGTNFAWIVPLPSVPDIQPASTGLFPTLQTIFEPEIVLSVTNWWLALPIAAAGVWLFRPIRRETFWWLLLIGIALLLAAMLMPALSTAKSRAVGVSGWNLANVQVLSRQNAGVFETVTLKSTDPASLIQWLNENGFEAPTNIMPVAADYIREGWVFAAARLRCEAGEKTTRATHPLAFTFPTAKPVYPLRLTSMATRSCSVDLYVFGPSRATAPNFAVQRCEAPRYGDGDSKLRLWPGELRIRHQELAKLVARAPVATKLTAQLDTPAMAHDAYIEWGRYSPSGATVYARRAAITAGGNAAALLFMVLVAVWWVVSQATPSLQILTKRCAPWLAAAALVVGMALFLALPKVNNASFRTVPGYRWRVQNNTHWLSLMIQDTLGDTNVFPAGAMPAHALSPADLDRLRQKLLHPNPEVWPFSPYEQPLTNFFTAEPIRFEVSPGNIMLRPVPHDAATPARGYELVWHDLDGAEAIVLPVNP